MVLLLLSTLISACCRTCPKPKAPEPPIRVEVTKRCMESLSDDIKALAAITKWPTPNTDGTTTLTPAIAASFRVILSGLINYIEVQLARCKLKKDAPTI